MSLGFMGPEKSFEEWFWGGSSDTVELPLRETWNRECSFLHDRLTLNADSRDSFLEAKI